MDDLVNVNARPTKKAIASKEKNLKILYGSKVNSVVQTEEDYNFNINSSKGNFSSKVLIDATELGDILPMLDEDYDIGMDNKTMYGEDIAPDEKNDIIQDLTYVMILKNFGKSIFLINFIPMMKRKLVLMIKNW